MGESQGPGPLRVGKGMKVHFGKGGPGIRGGQVPERTRAWPISGPFI